MSAYSIVWTVRATAAAVTPVPSPRTKSLGARCSNRRWPSRAGWRCLGSGGGVRLPVGSVVEDVVLSIERERRPIRPCRRALGVPASREDPSGAVDSREEAGAHGQEVLRPRGQEERGGHSRAPTIQPARRHVRAGDAAKRQHPPARRGDGSGNERGRRPRRGISTKPPRNAPATVPTVFQTVTRPRARPCPQAGGGRHRRGKQIPKRIATGPHRRGLPESAGPAEEERVAPRPETRAGRSWATSHERDPPRAAERVGDQRDAQNRCGSVRMRERRRFRSRSTRKSSKERAERVDGAPNTMPPGAPRYLRHIAANPDRPRRSRSPGAGRGCSRRGRAGTAPTRTIPPEEERRAGEASQAQPASPAAR